MTEYPLLPTPEATSSNPPKGGGGGGNGIKTPDRRRQKTRLGPVFQRLQELLQRSEDPVSFQEDPTGIAPERALVFEVAGSVGNFISTVAKIPGLDLLGMEEHEFEPDEDFHHIDNRKGASGKVRKDKMISGRLYMTMPDVRALEELISLWKRYQKGEAAPHGFAPLFEAFEHLKDIRPWGPEDRIPEHTVEYLTKKFEEEEANFISVEVDLWYPKNEARREAGKLAFEEALKADDGEILHQAEIPEIGYLGYLISVSESTAKKLTDRDEVSIVICDSIMMIHPQSAIAFPLTTEVVDSDSQVPPTNIEESSPIAAIFDAVPVERHTLLDGRLELDDPDDYGSNSLVRNRQHGTAMASLVIHGDRNRKETPLSRLVYFRPIMYASADSTSERTAPDRLLLDVIYRAVLRMKTGDGSEGPVAPDVFIVNLSAGVLARPFSGQMSPWARLLDYLAYEYNILFLVSAGNIMDDFLVADFRGPIEFEDASPEEREAAILKALNQHKFKRSLLSPAEGVNVVTVGAWHEDATEDASDRNSYYPYATNTLFPEETGPNMSSALGLGHRKAIKPDIFMPGGRERVRINSHGEEGLRLKPINSGRLFGLKCAAPDTGEGGDLTRESLSAQTSAATALATRASHQIYDSLLDPENGNLLDGVDPEFHGVIVKAMLVHRTKWGRLGRILEESWGPKGPGAHYVRRDNIARLLGYGMPEVDEVLTCAPDRATMIGHGVVSKHRRSNAYRVPLPVCLSGIRKPRTLTVSLAWFSPVDPWNPAYRLAKLEVSGGSSVESRLGVSRFSEQPSHTAVLKGSLFHARYEGKKAVTFLDDHTVKFDVFCRNLDGHNGEPIRYGLAITIEANGVLQVYDDIRAALNIQPRP